VARLAVLASGEGTNFQAIVEALHAGARHECVLLIHDRAAARAAERAARLGVATRHATYLGRDRSEAESEIEASLAESKSDLTVLAGFMRILSPAFVAARNKRIVNIHPSLLPKWPGANAIERAYAAGETEFGATVHYVDAGMDTGPIIASSSFRAWAGAALSDIESRVHEVEHELYPRIVVQILDAIDAEGKLQ
jgi:phosphoribosylglycinamide formyltransferase 1